MEEIIHQGDFDFIRDFAAEKPNAAGITFKCWKKVPACASGSPTLSTPGLSDAEYVNRLRLAEAPGFMQLAELLGNDMKALRAMREETKFVTTHGNLPPGAEFAAKVRGYLMANKLEWTEENLEKAVAATRDDQADGFKQSERELEVKS